VVPTPASAPVAVQPTAAVVPPTATPAAPTPTAATPTAVVPTPTTASAPTAFVVGNTGGEGVFIRRAPDTTPGSRIRAWPDGTRLVALGERAQAAGVAWEKVRDPEGTTGYVAAQYLRPEPRQG
jgi:hypothetical protein